MAYKKVEPDWVCLSCATKMGARIPERHVYTMHEDECGVCGLTTSVTEPRDFGVTRHLLKVVPLEIRRRRAEARRTPEAKAKQAAYDRERYDKIRKRPSKEYSEKYDKIKRQSVAERRRLRRIQQKEYGKEKA